MRREERAVEGAKARRGIDGGADPSSPPEGRTGLRLRMRRNHAGAVVLRRLFFAM